MAKTPIQRHGKGSKDCTTGRGERIQKDTPLVLEIRKALKGVPCGKGRIVIAV